MNLIKRNITVVVLLTAIVFTLSMSFYAIEVFNGPGLDLVTVHVKEFVEFEHQAMWGTLNTSSDTLSHYAYLSVGCFECPDDEVGWVTEYSVNGGLGMHYVSIRRRYPASCWEGYAGNHVAAHFDVIVNE